MSFWLYVVSAKIFHFWNQNLHRLPPFRNMFTSLHGFGKPALTYSNWNIHGNIELALALTTGTTSKHQRVMWLGLYRKLIEYLHIVVWHMRVFTRLLEVTWLECLLDYMSWNNVIRPNSSRWAYKIKLPAFLLAEISRKSGLDNLMPIADTTNVALDINETDQNVLLSWL